MEFDGLIPFAPGCPISSIGEVAQEFDLHNDGEIREFNVDFRDKFVRLIWRIKQPAWQVPEQPETWQRKTIGGLSLIFSDVHLVTTSGAFFETAGANELDFLEYTPSARNLGETRIVFGGSAEVVVLCSKCQLRTTELP